jgi:hypothetical protein
MPPANNVRTPDSYGDALQGNGKVKKVGRPLKFRKKSEFAKRRDKYSEEDMLEAIGWCGRRSTALKLPASSSTVSGGMRCPT